MSFVSSKGNILCRLIKIELYKIFAIINRAIKGLHCMYVCLALTRKTETYGGPLFDVAWCCQTHQIGHGQHPNVKLDMDRMYNPDAGVANL